MVRNLMVRSYGFPYEFRNLERRMDELFKGFGMDEFFNLKPRYAMEEIKETKDSYVMTVPMPGVAKENLKVTLEDNVLTIDAQMKGSQEDTKKEDGVVYLTRKLNEFSFHRSWELPEGTKEINPVYENGLLEITIKKPEGVKKEAKILDVNYKK